MKHESPKDGPVFSHYWNVLVKEVSARENFKEGHLAQLEILCDLYQEKADLEEALELAGGMTYVSEGRNGTQVKMRPEVAQMNRVRTEIRNYSRMLGLLLFKDTDTGSQADEDEFA